MPEQVTQPSSRPSDPITLDIKQGSVQIFDHSLAREHFARAVDLQERAQHMLASILESKPKSGDSEAERIKFSSEVHLELSISLLKEIKQISREGKELRLPDAIEEKLKLAANEVSVSGLQYTFAKEVASIAMLELENFHRRMEQAATDEEDTLDLKKQLLLERRDNQAAAPALQVLEEMIQSGELDEYRQYHPDSLEYRTFVSKIAQKLADLEAQDQEKRANGEAVAERFYHRKVATALLDGIEEQGREIRLKFGRVGAIHLPQSARERELIEAEILAGILLKKENMLTTRLQAHTDTDEITPVMERPLIDPDKTIKPQSFFQRAASWISSRMPAIFSRKNQQALLPDTQEIAIPDTSELANLPELTAEPVFTERFSAPYPVHNLGELVEGEIITMNNFITEEFPDSAGFSARTKCVQIIAHTHRADALDSNGGDTYFNEDNLGIMEKDGITYLIDADGMGGHGSGATASRDSVIDYLDARWEGLNELEYFEKAPELFEQRLLKQFERVSERINELTKKEALSEDACNALRMATNTQDLKLLNSVIKANDLAEQFRDLDLSYQKGMGACIVTATIEKYDPTKASKQELDLQGSGEFLVTIAHLGDARAYFFNDKKLLFRTRDHSQAQIFVDIGLLDRLEDASPDMRAIVTKANGLIYESKSGRRLSYNEGDSPNQNPKTYREQMRVPAGTTFLLCSDKIVDNLTDEQITAIVTADASLEQKAEILQAAAMAGPKRDHLSIQLGVIRDSVIG